MPLNSFVEYLNDCSHKLHPIARLLEQAGFHYRQGRLSADEVAARRVQEAS